MSSLTYSFTDRKFSHKTVKKPFKNQQANTLSSSQAFMSSSFAGRSMPNVCKSARKVQDQNVITKSSETARFTNQQEDFTLLQELKTTKKSLIDLKARNTLSIKEIARLQHELNLMRIQFTSFKERNQELLQSEHNKDEQLKELQYQNTTLLK